MANQEVPPYSRLEPGAQPWGRWVTGSVQSNANAIESVATNTAAQQQSISSQLNRLQLQIADLSERRAYYAVDHTYSLVWSSSTGPITVPGLSVTFTLNSDRNVLVRGKIDSYLEINATGSRTAFNSISISGLPNSVSGFSSLNSLGSGASVRVGSIADGEDVVQLVAGTYTLSATVAGSTSGGAGVSGTIQEPSIFVQVLDPL